MAELEHALTQAIAEMRGLIDGMIGEQKAICFDLFSQEFADLGLSESRSGLTSFRGSLKTGKHPTTGGFATTASAASGHGAATPAQPASGMGTSYDSAPPDLAAAKRSSKFHMAVIKSGSPENDLQQRLEALRRSLDERAARDRSAGPSNLGGV